MWEDVGSVVSTFVSPWSSLSTVDVPDKIRQCSLALVDPI